MILSKRLAHTFRIGSLFCIGLALAGCEGYAIRFNDNPVYNPPSLFTDYHMEDSALQACVQQTIEDAEVTRAEHLTRLNCSSAGIESLAGLETFSGLKALSLKDNEIRDLSPLKSLSRLETLFLQDNGIKSAEPLLSLLRLRELDLRDNADLGCGDAQQLTDATEAEVHLPEHC